MGHAVVRSGRDTWANKARPSAEYYTGPFVRAQSGQKEIFLYLPSPIPRGATVNSVKIQLWARGSSSGSRTLTARRISESWAQRWTNWNNRPSVAGPNMNTAIGSLSEGQLVEIDVTSAYQSFADGTPNYGIKIMTSGSSTHWFYSLNAGKYQPRLVADWSDAPDAPSDLSPSGGAVSVAYPTLRFNYTDVSGSTELASVQVQIDPSELSYPAFDSGEIAADVPELDLGTLTSRLAYVTTTSGSTTVTAPSQTFDDIDVGATITGPGIPAGTTITAKVYSTNVTISQAATATASNVTATIGAGFAGLVESGTTSWRVRVRDAAGLWSAWSDWASVSRTAKPAVTLTNPGAAPNNYVSESTPPIMWTYSGTQVAWRVLIVRDSDPTKIIYDSRKRKGTDTSHTIPKKVLKDDNDYRVIVRCWDAVDREGTPGDPTYSSDKQTFTVNYDPTVNAVDSLTATQVGNSPWVELAWTRGTAADYYEVKRDGKVLAVIDDTDYTFDGSTYTWRDYTASPQDSHTYRVLAVVNGKRSPIGPAGVIATHVRGIWLIDPDNGIDVTIRRGNVDAKFVDDSEAFTPVGSSRTVIIVSGMRGREGTVSAGLLQATDGKTFEAMRDDLYAIKSNPSRPLRMVWGDNNIEVYVHDVSIAPMTESRPDARLADVTFTFYETGDLPFDPRI